MSRFLKWLVHLQARPRQRPSLRSSFLAEVGPQIVTHDGHHTSRRMFVRPDTRDPARFPAGGRGNAW